MKKILPILFIIFMIVSTKAQDYERALGFRTGPIAGIEYKKFIDDVNALQALISFKRDGVQLTMIREFHNPVFLEYSDQVFIFFGLGAHAGYTRLSNETYSIDGSIYRKEKVAGMIGIDAIVGLEYHFIKYPIVITIDYKPFFEVSTPGVYRNNNADFAISFLYTF